MKEAIMISVLGDICSARGFRSGFDLGDEKEIFGSVFPLLQQSDLCIANLECPLSDRGTAAEKTGPCLRGKPSDMAVLKRAGIDAISLANNHILDYGQPAFFDTMKAAKECGVLTFGAGENINAAKAPLFIERKGWRIGLLSFAEEEFSIASKDRGGANLFDPYVSFDEISLTRQQCDYLIVLYHGGIEHYELPSPLLQKKCRKMAEAGADLVLCQHSHCIGTYEHYQNSDILYGQGNAIFGKIKGDDQWNQGILVSLELSDSERKLHFRVFEAVDQGISLISKESDRIRQMEELSQKLSDGAYIQEKWDLFCKKQEAGYMAELICWGRVRNKANRLLKNYFIRRISKRKKMVAMNLIRCDAHREVVRTILENAQKER